ncbi:YHYH protein [Prosthecobacter sp.]|uniref:YHYH protein n=1 Tax=Prosthecobacter sp. TaxID=1965333 RepID=UPI0037831BC2
MRSRRSSISPALLLKISGAVFVSACLAASSQLPPSVVKITTDDQYRRIQANGIPDHTPGQFPNRHNPNVIGPQSYDYKVPLHPKLAEKPSPFRMQPFGIAVNGVVFDPFAAEWWQGNPSSGWQYEPHGGAIDLGLDASNAHVQPNGAYHYHGIPTGLVEKAGGDKTKMVLVGWAADGFPIYNQWGHSEAKNASSPLKKLTSSYDIKKGTRPAESPGGKYDGAFVQDYEYIEGKGDLDASNGRFGVTPEFPEGTYHYVLTDTYPYIPRQFAGTPDASFERRGPPGGGFGPPGRGRRGGPGGGPPGGPPGMRPPPGFGPPPF